MADSGNAYQEKEAHHRHQQQQIDRIELAGSGMKRALSASEPAVFVLILLQALMHERRHDVKRDQGQKTVQQKHAIGATHTAAKMKSCSAPTGVVEPKAK